MTKKKSVSPPPPPPAPEPVQHDPRWTLAPTPYDLGVWTTVDAVPAARTSLLEALVKVVPEPAANVVGIAIPVVAVAVYCTGTGKNNSPGRGILRRMLLVLTDGKAVSTMNDNLIESMLSILKLLHEDRSDCLCEIVITSHRDKKQVYHKLSLAGEADGVRRELDPINLEPSLLKETWMPGPGTADASPSHTPPPAA